MMNIALIWNIYVKDEQTHMNENYFNIKEDKDIMELFLSFLSTGKMHNPMNMKNIPNH